MINVINKELSINEIHYCGGFAESTLMGTPVIIEAIVSNDDWTTLVIKSDNQSPMTFEGPFEYFPSNLQMVIENLTSTPEAEVREMSLAERFNQTLNVFSKSLALK